MTTTRTSTALFAALLLLTPPLVAQRGGTPSGSRSGTQSGQQAQQGRGGADQNRQAGAGGGDQSQQRVHVDRATRDRAQDCSGAASQARRTAGALTRTKDFDRDAAIRQTDRLRQEVNGMVQQHERFLSRLDEGQRQALEPYTRSLEQNRTRLESGLSTLGDQVGGQRPDAATVAAQAKELKREIKSWQKTYRKLEGQLDAG